MSTYLLAIVIGKFDNYELKTKRGVVVKSYVQTGKADLVKT